MSHPETRAAPGGARSIDVRDEIGVLRSRLANAEDAFFAIVERSSDGILVVDGHGVVLFTNVAALALLGRSRADLIGADVGFAILVGSAAEVELVRPGGEVVFAEMRVVNTEWEGQPCLLALLRDVTDRHEVQAELAERATHDQLTGLPNRFLLEDRLALALDRLSRAHGSLALFVCDLDGFKSVNDRWGHAAGDAVLVEAGRRIRSAVRPVDTVARVGGDEFVMLCEAMDETGASELNNRLTLAFREPFAVGGETATVGLSIGFVLADEPRTSATDLLAAADEQMYGQKRRPPDAAPVPPARSTRAPTDAGERDPALMTEYRFTLYVAGVTERSTVAMVTVDRLCQQYLPAGTHTTSVVDVLRAVDEADAARILVTPTLVRHEPLPVVRVIGDLSDVEVLAAALGLGHVDD